MSIIDQAVRHFEQQERLVITVPEWGTNGKPLEIHVLPMTMADINMIQRMSKKDISNVGISNSSNANSTSSGSNIEHAANLIIVKARDKDGNRLFKLEDKEALMQRADYRVITRITESIEQKFFSEVETHKANLRGSQSDISS